MIYRILAALPGVPLFLIAIGLIVQPSEAVGNLGMPLLEGVALSTQLGDMTSFFLCTALMCFLGGWKENAQWCYGAAMLLIGVAIFRTLAWAVHGAALTVDFIVIEIISTAVLLFCAWQFSKQPAGGDA